MPIKIRVMPNCIVFTPQNTREKWGCLEGLSIIDVNKQRIATQLRTFPYPMNGTGNVPMIRRNSHDCLIRRGS
ncbi:toxic protein SymE [Enterobacter sp. CC120223-11]|nr:toxic protein SymE [Enterobacter sp. CC120223-11]